MALTLTTGGAAAVAQVQSAALTTGASSVIGVTLPLPSTAGTLLVALLSNVFGTTITAAPTGWTLLKSQDQGGVAHIEVWIYPNNPGGLSTFNFTQSVTQSWESHISEWSGVHLAGTLDVAATGATATSGTTLALTTGGNVPTTGDIAIAAWIQKVITGVVTFTTPAGFTRLCANPASQIEHMNAEYKVNPATGAPLAPTMTSNTTTISAAGVLVVLKPIPAAVDQSTKLKYGSLTAKLNTLDFALQDPVTEPVLGDAVTMTTPSWSGKVVAVTRADVVDLKSSHKLISVAAVNSSTAPGGAPPGPLTDTATGGGFLLQESAFKLLLEDGSGFLILEDGGNFGYKNLYVRTTQNLDGTTTTHGSLITYTAGFLPGMTFLLTSSNLGYSAQAFTITNVTTTWQGLQQPAYVIEFGTAIQTLANLIAAPPPVAVVPIAPPPIVPATTVTMGQFTCTPGIKAMGGGIVTVGSAAFTVSGAGHTVQAVGAIDVLAYSWNNYVGTPRRAVRMVIDGGIYTGAWQETPYGWSGGSTAGYRVTLDGGSASGIAIAAGNYNVLWQIDTQATNQLQVFSGWGQVAVT